MVLACLFLSWFLEQIDQVASTGTSGEQLVDDKVLDHQVAGQGLTRADGERAGCT